MRRDALADDLATRGDGPFVPPAYDDYAFHRVPNTALSVLGADVGATLPGDVFDGVETDASNVVVVLLDGFGYDQWRAAEPDAPLLGAFETAGSVTPLTSTYPSETAAAITSLHTGVPPVEHGVLGWFQYLPSLPDVVQTLPWTTLGEEPVSEVHPDAPSWRDALVDVDTVYERATGVESTVVVPRDIAGSASGEGQSAGAEVVPYHTVADAAVRLRERLEAVDGPSYTLAYVPDLDAVAHGDGPGMPATRAQAESLLAALERELLGRLDQGVADDTLLVLTADHGHVDTGGENLDVSGYAPVRENLAGMPGGATIPAVGGPRNVQLHLADEAVEEVAAALETDFDCRTYTREEYLERGLFGPGEPGETFEACAPDLVCVHETKGMWDRVDGHLSLVGMHGGQTRAEMLVPFAAARLSELG